MARRLEIDLKETALELKSFLPQPKNGRQTERVQALELLNTPRFSSSAGLFAGLSS